MTSRSKVVVSGTNGKMIVSRSELPLLAHLTATCWATGKIDTMRWGPILVGVHQVCQDLDVPPQVLMAVVGSLKQKGYIEEWKTDLKLAKASSASVSLTAEWHRIYCAHRDHWMQRGGCQPLADVFTFYSEMETGHSLIVNVCSNSIHNDIARWHAGLPPFSRLCFEEACNVAGYTIQPPLEEPDGLH